MLDDECSAVIGEPAISGVSRPVADVPLEDRRVAVAHGIAFAHCQYVCATHVFWLT